jgi:hypothetical protein
MVENVRITAETFEDVQAILASFHAVAKKLPYVPDSLVQQMMQANNPFPPRG